MSVSKIRSGYRFIRGLSTLSVPTNLIVGGGAAADTGAPDVAFLNGTAVAFLDGTLVEFLG